MVWAFKKGAPLNRANRVAMMVFCIMVEGFFGMIMG
jgi:hypothetical protein